MNASPSFAAPIRPPDSALAARLAGIVADAGTDAGADGAGLLLMDRDGALRFATATDAPGQVIEVAEELCFEGPCHDAFTTEDVICTDDVRVDGRWPRLQAILATTPIRAVIGAPVMMDGMSLGSINVFAHEGRDLRGDEVSCLHHRAEEVAAAVAEALADQHPGDPLVDRLREAVARRDELRRAADAVAAESGSEPPAALVRMRQVGAATGLSVIDVARWVLERGGLPAPIELGASVHAAQLARAEHARLALSDPLTGLANRTRLIDRLDQAIARSERTDARAAVLFVDLDRFKVVNDSLGHEAGDQVLTTVAARLSEHVRPHDTVARLGGDEFAVLCEDVGDPGVATGVAERIAAALAEPITVTVDLGPRGRAVREVTVGASIGAAFSAGGEHATALLRDADMAMYAAKSAGGGRVELFSPPLRDSGHRRMRLELDLRTALDDDRLGDDGIRLVYQPMVELPGGRPTSVEALVRWTHPDLGPLAADEVVAVAEEAGLIVRLGASLLRAACCEAAGWGIPLDEGPLVAVNVSARQLSSSRFVDDVRAALGASGLPPRALCLELTESQLLEATPGGALDALETLAGEGVHLSLDDFGTGYSSLAYLTRLPVTKLKIDRSFVDGLGDDHHDTAVVEAVIGLAAALGYRTVAEGVETQAQADALVLLGCGLAQGYLYSRPVEAHEVAPLLAGSA